MEYKIVSGYYTESSRGRTLNDKVNDYIKEGWIPIGGAFVIYRTSDLLGQAMMREDNL